MTDPRDEALRMALEAFKEMEDLMSRPSKGAALGFLVLKARIEDAIAAIRAALEQKPEPDCEPAAWLHISERDGLTPPSIYFALRRDQAQQMINRGVPMRPLYYATPPQRTPQRKPLTEDEIVDLWWRYELKTDSRIDYARAIERAHGITENKA